MKHYEVELVKFQSSSVTDFELDNLQNKLNYMNYEGKEIMSVQMTKTGFLIIYAVDTTQHPAKKMVDRSIHALQAVLASNDTIIKGFDTLAKEEVKRLLSLNQDHLIKEINELQEEVELTFTRTVTIPSKL